MLTCSQERALTAWICVTSAAPEMLSVTNWKEGIAVTPGCGKGNSALGWDGAERGTAHDKSSIEPWQEQRAPAAQCVV